MADDTDRLLDELRAAGRDLLARRPYGDLDQPLAELIWELIGHAEYHHQIHGRTPDLDAVLAVARVINRGNQ